MRWIWISFVALLVGFAVVNLSEAEESASPTPGDIAEWVRSGVDTNLERAANATGKLGVEQLRKVFEEIRDQSRVHGALRAKRVHGLTWEESNLDAAVAYLQTITGLNYYITPKVRSEKIEDISISLAINDVSIHDLLNMMTEPFGMAWAVRQGVVFIGTTEEFAGQVAKAPATDAGPAALRRKIDATKVSLSVKEQPFRDVVKTLQIQTGFNIVIDPRVSHEVAPAIVSALQLSDVALSTALNMLVAHSVDAANTTWIVRGQVILITSKEFVQNK